MTTIGSDSLQGKRAHGPTSRRKEIATIRSASALISTAPATGSRGSSTGSNNVVGSRRATTGLPPTTLPSFNSRQLGYGCGLMSPRPNEPLLFDRVPLKYPFQFIDLVLVLLFGYRGALEINEILKG